MSTFKPSCQRTAQSTRQSPEQSKIHSTPAQALERPQPSPLLTRPRFNTFNTSDRLRESSNILPPCSMESNIRKDRKSLFKEVGLDDNGSDTMASGLGNKEFGDLIGISPISPTSTITQHQVEHAEGGHDEGRNAAGWRQQIRQRSVRKSRGKAHDVQRREHHGHRHGQDQAHGHDHDQDHEDEDQHDPQSSPRSPPPLGATTKAMESMNSMNNTHIGTRAANNKRPWYTKLATGGRRPRIRTAASAPPPSTTSSLSRVTMVAMLIAVVLPGFSYNNGRGQTVGISGADAGVVRGRGAGHAENEAFGPGPFLETRANSPTQVCKRWAHQTALLNGTVYIYGGQSKTTGDQTTNTWNNNFLTLDLTKSWDVKTPVLNGLPQPSGPPKVALGALWNDYEHLFLYGGQFGENPIDPPTRSSVWKYTVRSGTWSEDEEPKTSAGNNSEPGGVAVQRSAEGAGVSVPELGLSWYFGGHLDEHTTPGWSNQIWRVYLKSLLEFTHPGYTNTGVQSLRGGTGAGEDGLYRNITEGGLQRDGAFYERADGVLVFIPGWGDKGVLIGLGGGTNVTFSNNMNTLDVYDIARSEWYHQDTTGIAPSVRVNPCAVVASAPDASSFQVYLFGGQNLEPYASQVQYSDMYILSIPAFTWIRVDSSTSGSTSPSARAGHTCNLRDGQMVVVGGYIGQTNECDSPGIYVFNASSLEWTTSFRALDHPPDLHPENSVMAASFGYRVPRQVVSAIGGGPDGSATVTAPAKTATGGPFATGRSPVFTVTVGGSTATQTAWGPGATGADGQPVAQPGVGSGQQPGGGMSAGLIAAAVIAALAGLLAGYLGFCAWLYRRQVNAYRTHLAVANRYSGGAGASHASLGGIAAFFGRKGSKGGSRRRQLQQRPGLGAAGGTLGGGGGGGGVGGLDGAAAGEDEKLRGGHLSDSTTAAAGGQAFGWVGRKGDDAKVAPWLAGTEDDPSMLGSGTTAAAASGSSGGAPRPGFPSSPYGLSAGTSLSGATGSTPSPQERAAAATAAAAARRQRDDGSRPRRSGSDASSTEGLLEDQDLSFFSVVMAPRRALRVVNGFEDAERE